MRIVGPNTQGLANFGNGTIASFSTMFVEVPALDGPIAVASQSGGMSSVTYGLCRRRGLGVRHVHATGNEADVTVADIAWAVAHDPGVKLLLMYLETIANPDLLAQTAQYARERDLPIVAVKAGRSASGQKAASSHTGALANEDRVVDAFFRHHGIWRVRDPQAMALAAEAYLKGWRPQGRKLVVISNSGASCVMGADSSEDYGLPLAELSAQTKARRCGEASGIRYLDEPDRRHRGAAAKQRPLWRRAADRCQGSVRGPVLHSYPGRRRRLRRRAVRARLGAVRRGDRKAGRRFRVAGIDRERVPQRWTGHVRERGRSARGDGAGRVSHRVDAPAPAEMARRCFLRDPAGCAAFLPRGR
jgi:hypothetical protein